MDSREAHDPVILTTHACTHEHMEGMQREEEEGRDRKQGTYGTLHRKRKE